ncbi:hypothetical protein EJ071_30915 [Mesorhizobium sp. M1B.F.Ca.ET.045.04.1.1]|nr:hypothetical protein EJ071_30915 [Mesorhizobium sp. M1B.F.Ca.ET.045.04.1.1]
MEIGGSACQFVILGRSKERSDAAQTPGSMPLLKSAAAVQNSALLRPSAEVTAWILGSSFRFASLRQGRRRGKLRPTANVCDDSPKRTLKSNACRPKVRSGFGVTSCIKTTS